MFGHMCLRGHRGGGCVSDGHSDGLLRSLSIGCGVFFSRGGSSVLVHSEYDSKCIRQFGWHRDSHGRLSADHSVPGGHARLENHVLAHSSAECIGSGDVVLLPNLSSSGETQFSATQEESGLQGVVPVVQIRRVESCQVILL